MTIFAIMGTGRLPQLGAAIMDKYPGQFFKLAENQWFVSDTVTSREVSDKIGITALDDNARTAEGVVLSVSNYWGHTNKQLWEWLLSREGIPGG